LPARLVRLREALPWLALSGLLAIAGAARVYVRCAQSEASIRPSSPSSQGKLSSPASLLPHLRFSDQRGRLFDTGETLKGQVWIFDFIFTTCTTACPLITSRFVGLQRRLSEPSLRFVSISVDPEHDTNVLLAQYATRWAAGETRWLLVRPDLAGLELLLSGLGLAIERNGADVVHTERLFLVDREGRLVGDYDSKDDAALARLVTAASEQLGRAPATVPLDQGETGAVLFTQLGCAGCHADGQIAPPLAGLLGRQVMLERGGAVAVDRDYLRQSIIDPGSQLVAGYPNSMPSYSGLLAAAQVQRLVDFVALLPATAPTATIGDKEPTTGQIDPVCGMPVRVTASSPSADYRGQSYHFCSAACARRFSNDPNRYASALLR